MPIALSIDKVWETKNNHHKKQEKKMNQPAIINNDVADNPVESSVGLVAQQNDGIAPRILVVEDEGPIQRIIKRVLSSGHYESESAYNAEEARALCRKSTFEVVLCDIGLPGESGISFVRWLKSHYPETAFIMVTGANDMDMADQALKHGAYGYVVKPFTSRDLLISISGALIDRQRQIWLRESNTQLQEEVSQRTRELAEANEKLEQTMHGVIKAMAAALESRDPYTGGHQQRVAELSVAIGRKLSLTEDQIQSLYIAAMVHDIGKISIPAEILSKPGRLTDIEFQLIKTHAETGYKILREIDFPWPIADIVHQHHERIDGTGYPRGLTENELEPESKIIMVADVVEAMASHRPYRPALGIEKALAEIKKNRGRLYAANVVDACLEVFEKDEFHF